MPFVKLDCGILNSSIWVDYDARAVFITALLMAEPIEITQPTEAIKVSSLEPLGFTVKPGWYGFVRAAGPGIVSRCGIEKEAGMAALERLQGKDNESRSSDFDGRRMVRIDGGFIILNYDKYRQRDYTASERMKKYRERNKALRSERNVTRHVTQAEAEAEAENTYSEENYPEPDFGSGEPMGAVAPAPTKKRGRKPIEASPEASAFIAWFVDLLEKTGSVRPTLTDTDRRNWAADYDKLVRLDKFTDSQIRAACSFARKDAFYAPWFWRPTFLRVKKDGVLTIQKILSRMKQQGWTDPESRPNIYAEPPDWRERAKRAFPGDDMTDRNWFDLPADFRMKILATK